MTDTDTRSPIRFESRKDNWFSLVIWLTIAICVTTIFIIGAEGHDFLFDLFFSLLMIGLILFILSIYFNTYYIISEHNLFIRSGPMKQTIPLESIKEIKKIIDVLSNPALSTKRILIKHRKSYIGVQISPMDRDDFMYKINRRIELLKTG